MTNNSSISPAVSIEVDRGIGKMPAHQKTEKENCEFLVGLLEKAELTGTYHLTFVSQAKSSTRFKVISGDRETVSVRVMAGDSGTCWQCRLRPPKGENPVYVCRILSLWNGYDGQNVPDAVLANQGIEPPDRPVAAVPSDAEGILSMISRAEQQAKRYRDREARIADLLSQVNAAILKADELQTELDAVQAEHDEDAEAQMASQAIDAFRAMFAAAQG